MKPTLQLSLWFAVLLIIGVASLLAPRFDSGFEQSLNKIVFLAFLWMFMFFGCWAHYGKRALWLLLTAPLALYYPAAIFLLSTACLLNRNSCP